jgi:hypothetical protein
MALLEHADISHLSGFHTPALARYFIEYTGDNLDDLKKAARFANEQELPILTISGGKNLLLAFDEYPGLVIHNNSRGYEVIKAPFLKGEKNIESKERGICLLNKSSAWNFTEIPYRSDLTEKARELRKNMT